MQEAGKQKTNSCAHKRQCSAAAGRDKGDHGHRNTIGMGVYFYFYIYKS